jgi:5-methylcytosine-specific restriction enzyme A
MGFLEGDEVEFDHFVPLALGGADDLSNIGPMHKRPCHREKTSADIAAIAKAKRLEKRRKGKVEKAGRRIQSRPFPKRKQRRMPDEG